MSCEKDDVCSYLDTLLQTAEYPDVSMNGLQVSGKKEITSIATAVTASLHVIKEAVKLQVDALFVHHGLFLHGRNQLLHGVFREKIALLLQNNINLFGYHLPLDAHEELGNNWAFAKKLGWDNLKPFGTHNGITCGVQGTFSKRPREVFEKELSDVYGCKSRVAFGGSDSVSSCALLSGGGHKWIDEAVATGVDCFVTGTADEPTWHIAHEEKINFFAFGHAATEKIGVRLLGEHLKERFSLKHVFIDEENPF